MKQKLKKNVLLVVLMLGGVISAEALTSSSWCYSDSGNERYNPSTHMVEHRNSTGEWVPDNKYLSNPAYVKYNSGKCGSTGHHYEYQTGSITLNTGKRNHLIMSGHPYKLKEDVNPCMNGDPCYEASELPEWNYTLFGGISYDDSDFRVNAGRLHVNTRITTLSMGVRTQKDRLSLTGALRYEYARGYSNFSGADSDVAGFLFMPGYQVLSQDEQFVDLGFYGMLDMSYVSRKHVDNQTRVMPGVGVTASRTTPIGLFSLAYSYEYNRNLNGDKEITGSEHIDTQIGSADYTLPITKNFYLGGGLLYTYAMDMPSNMDNDFLEAHLTAGAIQMGNWNFMADYYASVDGTGNQGINFVAGYQW
jgi:hypothetical protein